MPSWAEDDASVYWDGADLYERAKPISASRIGTQSVSSIRSDVASSAVLGGNVS
jgi:hypothetical protein